MTARVERIRSADLNYQRLVEEATTGLFIDGMVDIETAAKADALGYSTTTLTNDAEALLAEEGCIFL